MSAPLSGGAAHVADAWRRPDKPKYASSAEEWKIVVEPEEGFEYSSGRIGTPLAVFLKLMDEKNALLRERGLALMVEVELIGARLYTGPLYEKYNRCTLARCGKAHPPACPALPAL